jgi:Fe-S cluster assembly protein SufB
MMATVLEERVEPAAFKGGYQFGFYDPDQSVCRAPKGLDREIVEQISAIKGEPTWMRDSRLKAFDIFLQKPIPAWGGNVAKMKTDMKMTYLKKESSDEFTSTGRSCVD